MRPARYNSTTFAALVRRHPQLVVKDENGVQWTRGAAREDNVEDLVFRWEYKTPPRRRDLVLSEEDYVWLPLARHDHPLPFLVVGHRRVNRQLAREMGGPPRGEGMERARGRKTAFSAVCGAAMLQYLPDLDPRGDRSALAICALRSRSLLDRVPELALMRAMAFGDTDDADENDADDENDAESAAA